MWQTFKDGLTWAGFFAARLAEGLLGRVSWTPPAWCRGVASGLKRRWRPISLLVMTALAAWSGWSWWQNRPVIVPPEALIATMTSPGPTNYATTPSIVQPLHLAFNHPAKPIKAGEVAEGFVLKPDLPGRWTWVDETSVTFQPTSDWPIGTAYRVRIEGETCCTKVRPLADHDLEFITTPFTAHQGTAEFYQDPTDARVKRALFEFTFSHPVEAASLESRLSLVLKNAKDKDLPAPKFSISYAANRLSARVQSEPLTLPDEGGQASVLLAAGVRSMLGGPEATEDLQQSIVLPARNSLMVSNLDTTVVNNAGGTPEQVLLLGFNQEVDEKLLLSKLRFRLLPVREPDPKTGEGPTEWWLGQIPETVQRAATVIKSESIPGEREVSDTHMFRIALEPGRQLLVDVDGGLSSFGNFIMPKKYQGLVTAPDFPKLLRFVGEGGLLSLRGERRLSIAMRNLPMAQLTVARVRPDELHHLVRFNDGTMAMPSLRGLGRDDLADRFSEVVTSPAETKRSAVHYAGVDLARHWTADTKGVFLLSLRAYSEDERGWNSQEDSDPFDQYAYYDNEDGLVDRRLVVLSDLGVISKREKNGQRRVYVQQLKSARPAVGAMVSVIARNGARVVNAEADGDGVAVLPDLTEFVREREPVMLLVSLGDDTSFLPMNDYQRQVDFSRFDVGGEATPIDRAEMRAHLFSDRGLYRPGETLHVGAIVRREDWLALPEGSPLEWQLTDPKGQLLSALPVALDATGFHEFGYDISAIAPTGNYTISLTQWLDAKRTQSRWLGSTNVRVKEFQPDRMKVKSAFSPVASALWLKPDDLKVNVGVEHLFGGAAVGRQVTAQVRMRHTGEQLPGFDDYTFAATDSTFQVQEYALDPLTTDDTGAVVFDAGVSGIETQHYQLDVMIEAFELAGGRSVPSDLGARISQADWLLGLKSDDRDLSLSRGAERSMHFIAIDALGKPVSPEGLNYDIVDLRYVSILTRGDDGLYRYESRLKEVPVAAKPLTIKDGLAALVLPTGEAGDFRVRVYDASSMRLVETGYSVAGTGNATRALERNAELKVKLLDAVPEPGSELRFSIEAPYAGSGLITIERERVITHAWFTTTDTRSVQSIRLPADLEGQAYLNVQMLRSLDSKEIFMSPMSYATQPFRVAPTARTLSLTVDAPKKHRPGQDLDVLLSSSHPSRVALFAVDEGILQVAGYRLQDPKDRFFAKRQLEVETAQILDLVLPEFSLLAAAAGGDAEGAIARNLNPFKRQLDKPAVYWAGLKDVDGESRFAIPVPDSFNGRLKIMAVAVSAERIGITTADTEVRAPFVLMPSAPAFVSPGDEFEFGLSIQREAGTGAAKTDVVITADQGLALVGPGKQSIDLRPGSEASLKLRIKAGDTLGAGRIRIDVSSGSERSSRAVEISLRPQMPYQGQQQFGRFDGKKRDVTGLRALWPNFAKREFIAGHTPLVMIGGIQAHLEDFPHQCSEQVLSQAMGRLLVVKYPEYASAPVPAKHWQGLFDVLRARSNSAGGIGLWVAEENADVFVTAWAGLFFLEAEAAGVVVPKDLIQRNLDYLRSMSTQGIESTRFERWLALYVRARRGEVVTLPMQDLIESEPADAKDGLGAKSLRAALHALHMDTRGADAEMKAVLTAFRKGLVISDYQLEGYVNPVLSRNLALMILYRHFPNEARNLPANAFAHLELAVQENLLNTVSSGSASLALLAQAGQIGDQVGASDLTLSWLGADKQTGTFGSMRTLDIHGAWPEAARSLSIANAGTLPTWFSMRESGYAKALPTVAVEKGLELARDYRSLDDKPIGAIKVGDEIEVSLRLRATDLRWGALAVVELLPAGFELLEYPVDEYAPRDARFISAEQSALTFLDAREDRLVLYVSSTEAMQTYKYRLKATSRGKFLVPPTYASDMYDARRMSLGATGTVLPVE